MQIRNKYSDLGLKEPTLDEIAAEIDVPIKGICEALDALSDPISLYEPAFSDGDDCVLVMDQISDTTSNENNWITDLDLRDALTKLSPKEKQVIDMRYYQGKTQTEVSSFCNISQAQVSRLENAAIKKLRTMLTV